MSEFGGYESAERYLLGTIDEVVSRRSAYKLERIQDLLREMKDPHRAYPTIHVGGTSGKGSVCTMIAAALRAAGCKTGLHTKPHLHSMTERARIDGRPISRERFAALLGASMPAIERTASRYGRPTYYETLLAVAFAYFAQEQVDVAVIEVGLGGRLDATNVIVPVVAAITSVGYDHTEVLGNTIEEIAREKAGIAKRGVPLVVADVLPAARSAIERYAAKAGAPVVHVRDAVTIQPEAGSRALFRVTTAGGSYALTLPLLGVFQRRNAATAIAVLENLPPQLRPAPDALARGFAEIAIPGRMELISGHPPVLFDIAHNAEKAASLAESLREHFPGRRFHYVVAIGEAKDARGILTTLAHLPSTFTFTSFKATGRPAMRPARLAALAESIGTWGRAIDDPVEALTVARRTANFDDVVVVTGSTFVVAGLRQWFAAAPA
ncbi:MAG TPA: folylpolyglutamate synthase/dihydrofolate synthase family protein [Candidatus Babeliales bacterium]|nr:folylpolyglutamate synthase/dihydrofolate synthase family protein [Candidatus Babeliales bacterium]